jgi:UDP-3-O-[3-hydroxymyristoyl] glucosamine N-acyltransferase
LTNYGFDCTRSRSHGSPLEEAGFDFRKSLDESIEMRPKGRRRRYLLSNDIWRCQTTPDIRQAGIVDVAFGARVIVTEPCNLYGCRLGDDVFVGPFVEIQKQVVIGARSRVQSHAFICELVTIGEDCFIGHGVMFINDLFISGGPAKGDQSRWKSTIVGNKVSIGSNATILPVSICEGGVIGAGAVVTSDITGPGIYAGNPARKIRDVI